MAETTQKIVIDIKAETTKATNNIKRLNKQIDGLKKQVNKSDKSLTKTTKSIKGLNLGFKQLTSHLARLVVIYGSFQTITNTVKTFADFEQTIATLGAISGSTGEQLQNLETKSLQLGSSTVFSASQVAGAMVEMARAGLSYQQTLDGISGVLDLAVVGNMNLSDAVKATTGAMHGFSLKASDMGIIADVMAKASSDSAQSVGELSEAMAKVAPVATSLGNSFTETTALLEVLADNNIKTALAGTNLKIAMLRLSSNNEAKIWLDKLSKAAGGVDTKMFDATGRVLPFRTQLEKLKFALSKVSTEAGKMYLAKIVGTEAITGTEVLMGNLDGVDKKLKALNSSFGFSGEASRQMMDTLKGSYAELMASLESLQLKIGEDLSPALRDILDNTTDWINSIDDKNITRFTDAIALLIKGVIELDKWASASATTLRKYSEALSDNAKAFLIATAVIWKFRSALGSLLLLTKLHPVIAGITGVIGLAIGATVAWQKSLDDLKESTEDTSTAIGGLNASIVKIFSGEDLSDKEIREIFKNLDDDTQRARKSLTQLQEELKKLETDKHAVFTLFTDKDEARLALVKSNIKQLETNLNTAGLATAELTNRTKNLVKARMDEIKAINATKDAHHQLSVEAQPLAEAELKTVERLTKQYTARKDTLEKTLGVMRNKERKYAQDIIKLEADIAKVRANYANKRKTAQLNLINDIADINARGLSELQQYNDAQKRADEQLALAKKALAEGNLTIAKEYFAKYQSLIEVNSSAEIKEGEKVVKTLSALNKELINDKKNGHEFYLKLLKSEESREIAIIENKIALKKAEMAMVKLQIDLQIESLKLMGSMLNGLKGIAWDEQLVKFKKDADDIQIKLDKIFEKQRKLKIKPTSVASDASKVAGDIQDDVQSSLDGKPIEPKIDANTAEAEKEFILYKNKVTGETISVEMGADVSQAGIDLEGFVKVVEQTRAEATMDLDTTPAQTNADNTKSIIERTKIVPIMDLDISPALASDRRMRKIASRPLPKIVQIIEHHHIQTGNYSTGGAIPRFAVGGALDNGIGHSRKSGALSGYGGGDKIKALLEAGEFIIRKEAVKALGLARLYAINQGKLPRYQLGGQVGTPTLPRYSMGGSVSSSGSNKTMDINLNMGGQTFVMQSQEETANQLAEFLQRSEF